MQTFVLGEPLSNLDIFLRLLLATGGGLLLGLDRELRGIAAGIRTHAMVSLSSAVITISAMLLYAEIRLLDPGSDPDPLRVIQGLAQAIGFIAAGAIFFARGDVHNLTSAANLWLACALGIVAGAGQFFLASVTVIFGVVLVSGVRLLERRRRQRAREKRAQRRRDRSEAEGNPES